MKLNLARYRFSFIALDNFDFSGYAGATLRGVFGHELMRLSGISIRDIEHGTEEYRNSLYADVFEPVKTSIAGAISGSPVPYIIEAESLFRKTILSGETVSFDMVLLSKALHHLPKIILAWRRALLRGLDTRNKVSRAELVLVQHESVEKGFVDIYSKKNPILIPHHQQIQVPVFLQAEDVFLRFITPLRLQHNGKVLSASKLTSHLLLLNILRRFSLCFPEKSPKEVSDLLLLCNGIWETKSLKHQNWVRYSNRQKNLIRLTGSVGDWFLSEVPVELLSYIWIGQYLHVGKNTAFGLGKYQMLSKGRE